MAGSGSTLFINVQAPTRNPNLVSLHTSRAFATNTHKLCSQQHALCYSVRRALSGARLECRQGPAPVGRRKCKKHCGMTQRGDACRRHRGTAVALRASRRRSKVRVQDFLSAFDGCGAGDPETTTRARHPASQRISGTHSRSCTPLTLCCRSTPSGI